MFPTLCATLLLFAWTTSYITSHEQAQATETAASAVGLPKPAVDLTPGTWKYQGTYGGYPFTASITIKDDGGVWTVTTDSKFSNGRVTDVSTLEKATLIVRKESFRHFPKPGQPWKPVAINLDFNGNKVTGTITNAGGQLKPVAVDLAGPVFSSGATYGTIGCLPLADGYSISLRTVNVVTQKASLVQLKVMGMERVTVSAGTFDSWKVELTSADRSYKETVWISKDSRTAIKTYEVDVVGNKGGKISTSTELVP